VPENPQMEFRAFVHKNSLNAITQYFSFCYFPQLVKEKDDILKRVVDFFNSKVRDALQTHESYVIDFFVLKEKILIIELNPFHIGAGAGLFSWKDNREVFMNGPLEFRIVETMPTDPREVLPIQWTKFLDSLQLQKKKCAVM